MVPVAGPQPEEKVPGPAVQQSWRDVTFLHWGYDPAVVKPVLPHGLEPEVRDGQAWVGISPFRVERFRLSVLPPAPGLSSFPETNVRTYAVGPTGRDGIWFMTLEVDSLPATIGGRGGTAFSTAGPICGSTTRTARCGTSARDEATAPVSATA